MEKETLDWPSPLGAKRLAKPIGYKKTGQAHWVQKDWPSPLGTKSGNDGKQRKL